MIEISPKFTLFSRGDADTVGVVTDICDIDWSSPLLRIEVDKYVIDMLEYRYLGITGSKNDD